MLSQLTKKYIYHFKEVKLQRTNINNNGSGNAGVRIGFGFQFPLTTNRGYAYRVPINKKIAQCLSSQSKELSTQLNELQKSNSLPTNFDVRFGLLQIKTQMLNFN